MAKIKTIHTLGNDYDIYDASAIHDVDSALNETSINPVENQVVTSALNTKSEVGHDHNDAYYTKDEADTILAEAQKFAPTVNSTTANYQLSQWASTDRILMADFNSDNEKIDTALSALAEAVAAKADGAAVTALAEAVNGKGNCQILTTSYVGTGAYGSENPVSVTFEKVPLAVLVFGSEIGLMAPGCSVRVLNGSVLRCTTTWAADNKSVSWWGSGRSDYMLNEEASTYTVVYLCVA